MCEGYGQRYQLPYALRVVWYKRRRTPVQRAGVLWYKAQAYGVVVDQDVCSGTEAGEQCEINCKGVLSRYTLYRVCGCAHLISESVSLRQMEEACGSIEALALVCAYAPD